MYSVSIFDVAHPIPYKFFAVIHSESWPYIHFVVHGSMQYALAG